MPPRCRTIAKSEQPPTYETVQEIARMLPGVEASTSYGTPALKVRGKLFIRLKEDGLTIVLRCGSFERAHLIASEPDIFFITDHYRDYPYVLLRFAAVSATQLAALVAEAWRQVAPKTLIVAYDAQAKR
jgi:hypothetical protein